MLLVNSVAGQSLGVDLLSKIHTMEPRRSDNFYKWTSHSVYPVSIGLPASMLIRGYSSNNEELIKAGWVQTGSLLLCTGLSQGLKIGIRRERPYKAHPGLFRAKLKTGPFSFPSGHSATAFASATSLCLAYPRWYVIAPSMLWAGTVAWSRMHLGVHYAGDVLGGLVIGVGSSLIMWGIGKATD